MVARATPQRRIEQACRDLGRSEVVTRCVGLLGGGACAPDFLVTLGGPAAVALLHDGMPPGQDYWLRVWAVRGLLWAGPSDDVGPLRAALTDESWRVREMSCKVAARYCLGDLLGDVAALEADPVSRVRSAAASAVARIVEHEP